MESQRHISYDITCRRYLTTDKNGHISTEKDTHRLKNHAYLKGKGVAMDKLRLGLPYLYKYTLSTYVKKPNHIAREVYRTL